MKLRCCAVHCVVPAGFLAIFLAEGCSPQPPKSAEQTNLGFTKAREADATKQTAAVPAAEEVRSTQQPGSTQGGPKDGPSDTCVCAAGETCVNNVCQASGYEWATGIWFSEETGWIVSGISLAVAGNVVDGAWYRHSENGDDIWESFRGTVSGNTLTVNPGQFAGATLPALDSSNVVAIEEQTTLVFTFNANQTISLTETIDASGQATSWSLQRFVASPGAHTGVWWNPGVAGALTVFDRGDGTSVGAWYLYDENGDAMWVTWDVTAWNSAINLLRFNGSNYTSGVTAGTAYLEPLSQDQVKLRYKVNSMTAFAETILEPFFDTSVAQRWYRDCDGDGFAPSTEGSVVSVNVPQTPPTNCAPHLTAPRWTRRRPSLTPQNARSVQNIDTDCDDTRGLMFPGQAQFQEQGVLAIGYGWIQQWDYNCDGVAQRELELIQTDMQCTANFHDCYQAGLVNTEVAWVASPGDDDSVIPECGGLGYLATCRAIGLPGPDGGHICSIHDDTINWVRQRCR